MPTEAPGGIAWSHCPPAPMAWIPWREAALQVLTTPWLLLPLLLALLLLLSRWLGLQGWRTAALQAVAVLLVSGLYSSLATVLLSGWLTSQLPPPPGPVPLNGTLPVAVILGRGDAIAAGTTAEAARLQALGRIERIHISGDSPATADRLVALGVPPGRISGDSCARTTWENALEVAAWLHRQAPAANGSPGSSALPAVILITDPWQLPRAARALRIQGVSVLPMAAPLQLAPHERNRLAIRETVATLLYYLQARLG